jgi:hypothetical protein
MFEGIAVPTNNFLNEHNDLANKAFVILLVSILLNPLFHIYLHVSAKWGHLQVHIGAYLLKARTVKPVEIAVAREWLCKHACC